MAAYVHPATCTPFYLFQHPEAYCLSNSIVKQQKNMFRDLHVCLVFYKHCMLCTCTLRQMKTGEAGNRSQLKCNKERPTASHSVEWCLNLCMSLTSSVQALSTTALLHKNVQDYYHKLTTLKMCMYKEGDMSCTRLLVRGNYITYMCWIYI